MTHSLYKQIGRLVAYGWVDTAPEPALVKSAGNSLVDMWQNMQPEHKLALLGSLAGGGVGTAYGAMTDDNKDGLNLGRLAGYGLGGAAVGGLGGYGVGSFMPEASAVPSEPTPTLPTPPTPPAPPATSTGKPPAQGPKLDSLADIPAATGWFAGLTPEDKKQFMGGHEIGDLLKGFHGPEWLESLARKLAPPEQ